MINASTGDQQFGIYEGAAGQWQRAVDTALSTPDDIADPGHEPLVRSNFYHVQPRSVAVLLR